MTIPKNLDADFSVSLWDSEPIDNAFEFSAPDGELPQAVVRSVERPWLFGYRPRLLSNGRKANKKAILILGGGGYVELMAGREGYQVAQWLAGLGFHAFVLVNRFPNTKAGAQAPIDDARRALRIIEEKGFGNDGIAVCGLSSGGHLGASLLSEYPGQWTEKKSADEEGRELKQPTIEFAILGYGPISTNAKGRQIVANKAPLPPAEKQELYDIVQPDVQLKSPAPPTFVVYSGNDPVVPVVNAYRLTEGLTKAGAAVELHVFANAPHGFALDTVGLPVSKWTEICEAWLAQGGFFE